MDDDLLQVPEAEGGNEAVIALATRRLFVSRTGREKWCKAMGGRIGINGDESGSQIGFTV